ncbi:hypothetical protein GQ44DRAFT_773605 [Phaeosphaeriaceae sp. PMI808]|nr:hypothetical protein GQ44DRAFT_773605 [Phaeosphaeriaceae sp. PMI808]
MRTESLNGLKEALPKHVEKLGDRLAECVDFGFIPQNLQCVVKNDPEMETLGLVLQFQGKYEEAETLFRDVFDVKRKEFGAEHTDTVATSARRGRSRSSSRTMARKRSSSSIHASIPPPKRSCSNSLVKQDTQRRNRVHRRLVMRDVGKSLYEARSPRDIVMGLLGGINDANILHRDVSIGNIMLNMAEDDGFLIDLGLAIKIDRANTSGAPSKTGTKVFIAIGALYGEDHSFMHDLESLSRVLFWKLAEIKKGKVDKEDKFTEEVGKEFTAMCKPLIPYIKELRKVVFPNGERWLREDRQLYSRMKSILQRVMETWDTM